MSLWDVSVTLGVAAAGDSDADNAVRRWLSAARLLWRGAGDDPIEGWPGPVELTPFGEEDDVHGVRWTAATALRVRADTADTAKQLVMDRLTDTPGVPLHSGAAPAPIVGWLVSTVAAA